jgi:hypothetical protein
MIEIKVDLGDENYIPDIQSWLDRVSPEHTSDLKTIYLLGDKAMTNVVTNFLPSHPRPQNINGIVSGGSVLLRKRENDERGGIEGSFYHEIGHLIFSKKDSFERRMYWGDLFNIWERFVGRFSYYYDAAYANDSEEIFARVFSFYMMVTGGKVKGIIDLPEITTWAMAKMEKIFSN